MNAEDLPSDSDQSDVDYIPSDMEKNLSEEESDEAVSDNEEKIADGNENGRKRRKKQRKGKKLKKSGKEIGDEKDCDNEDSTVSKPLNEEDSKKKADSLWADFMKNCGSVSKQQQTAPSTSNSAKEVDVKEPVADKIEEKTSNPGTNSVKVTEIFEFAGEEVRIEKEVEVEKETSSFSKLKSAAKPSIPKAGRGGGLASVLGQLGKKPKLSTLEKSKLDWSQFKKEEGIEEELQIHNKGKEGYLERQDFLQRADLRQFEIEKQLRTTRRSYF